MAHDVFISYAFEDKQIADAICNFLENNKIRCWIAPRDILPGQQFSESIVNAIDYAKIFVLVFSSNSDKSPHIMSEVQRAFNKEIIIIPFRIEAIEPSKRLDYFIGPSHWLDALTPPLENHIKNLEKTIDLLLSSKKIDIGPFSDISKETSTKYAQKKEEFSQPSKPKNFLEASQSSKIPIITLSIFIIFLIVTIIVFWLPPDNEKNGGEGYVVTTGSIDLTSNPIGAAIYIDGNYRGTTSTVVENLYPGQHSVKLTKAGYHDWIGTTSIDAGVTTYISPTLVQNTPPTTTIPTTMRSILPTTVTPQRLSNPTVISYGFSDWDIESDWDNPSSYTKFSCIADVVSWLKLSDMQKGDEIKWKWTNSDYPAAKFEATYIWKTEDGDGRIIKQINDRRGTNWAQGHWTVAIYINGVEVVREEYYQPMC